MCSNDPLSTDHEAGAWMKLVFVHDLLHKELDIAEIEQSENKEVDVGKVPTWVGGHEKKRWSSFFLSFDIF
jgi:hypothetical protein